jgi:hypothetical protein
VKKADTDASADVIEGDEKTKMKCADCDAIMLGQKNNAQHRRLKDAENHDVGNNDHKKVRKFKKN